MKIALTGASGLLGRLTTDELLERVDKSDVVLLTRDPAKLEDRGIEARAFDWSDVTPATLRASTSCC